MKYQVLQALENNPEVSQRALAKQIGLSLGKTNYCLRAVIDRGWVKARNFKNSSNKSAYLYQLTPQGVSAKARVTLARIRIESRSAWASTGIMTLSSKFPPLPATVMVV